MSSKVQQIQPIYNGKRSDSVNAYIDKVLKFKNKFDEDKVFEKAAIFNAISCSLRTEWFYHLSYYSKIDLCKQSKLFLLWLQKQTVNSLNYSDVINVYTSYRINKCKLKPQSSGCKVVTRALRNGLDEVNNRFVQIIRHIIWNTRKIIRRDRTQITLSQYFTEIHWLRNFIDDEKFLLLESPKQLIPSLTTLASTLLLEIKKAKQQVIAFLKDNPFENSKFYTLSSQKRELGYSCFLISNLMQLDKNSRPTSILSELLISDLISRSYENVFLKEWRKHKLKPMSFVFKGKVILPFVKSKVFLKENLHKPCRMEEFLMRWLCAAQCVQANDINTLKKSNFSIEISPSGEPLYVQCQYYKGRGQKDYFTPLISYDEIEAKAIISYLDYFDNESEKLFTYNNFIPLYVSTAPIGVLNNLVDVLKEKNVNINHSLENSHKLNKNTNIFLFTFRTLINSGSECYRVWEKKQKSLNAPSSMSDYNKTVSRPLPSNLFTPTAIKNSSVHARTDKYRDNDLVNYNSHSSSTEKIHYLTDENKDWVNLNGRLTRLVMNDLDFYVFRPNLDLSIKKIKNSIIQTKVITATGIKNKSILALQSSPEPLYEYINNQIIVLDTESTVINMLYYIDQANTHFAFLIRHSLEYFEKTVLPTVEWMHFVLEQKLSPKIVKKGTKQYREIKSLLPEKFHHTTSLYEH